MDINDINRDAAFSLVTNMKHLQDSLKRVFVRAEHTEAHVLGSIEFWATRVREDLIKLEDCPTAPRARAEAILKAADEAFAAQYPE